MTRCKAALWLLASSLAAQTPLPDSVTAARFEGRPAIVLSNDKIELTMFTTGGNFASLILNGEPTRMSPFWNPARIARDAGLPPRSAGGGHFVCVDGFGSVSDEEHAAGLPGHGEAHTRPWEITRAAKQNSVLAVTFKTNLPLVQEQFERTIRIADGESVVYVDSTLENLLPLDRPVNWAEHATIGSPFLEAGQTAVDMSAHKAKTRTYADEPDPKPHRLAEFQDFNWPLAPGANGQTIDVRVAPAQPNSLDHTTSLMDPGRPLAFVTALNPRTHLLLGYLFRRDEYPWIQCWDDYSNRGMQRGMEISTQPFDVPRREVLEKGPLFGAPVVRWLPAKSQIGSHFLFFYTQAPASFQRVDDVRIEGRQIIVEDHTAGQRIALPAAYAQDLIPPDPSGRWTTSYTNAEGQTRESTLTLTRDGEKLAGAFTSVRGKAEIASGSVSGNEIRFMVVRKGNGDEVPIAFKGTIEGDSMKLKMQLRDRAPLTMTAKRVAQDKDR